MQTESASLVFIVAVVAIIWGVVGLTCELNGYDTCVETAEKRPCIEGTLSYDEGECECLTEYGELEWHAYPGCDLD